LAPLSTRKRSLAVGGGGVDVDADLHAQRDGLDRILLGALVVRRRRRAAVTPAESGSEHERCGVIGLGQRRVGSGRQEQPHDRHVAGLGRAHEWRRALAERTVAAGVMPLHQWRLESRIRIGLVREQNFDQIDSIEVARWPGVGTAVSNRQAMHVHRRIQRCHVGFVVADIRVGAFLDEQRGLVVVGIDDGDDERRGTVGIDQVQIGSRIDERAQ
jgi:hypothetical protein